MAQPALEWQAGTVTGIRPETRQTKSFTLALPKWMAHRAGMHYDVRLTAPDGYQTERSYSVAWAPERVGMIDLTVERIADGEVSPYLHDVVVSGDQDRSPRTDRRVLRLGGGHGRSPAADRRRLRGRAPDGDAAASRRSARNPAGTHPLQQPNPEDVIYREEFDSLAAGDRGFEAFFTFTRQAPPGWTGYRRRIDAAMLSEVIKPFGSQARVYVCGPTLLVEAVPTALVQMRLPIEPIRTERFGPTGA